MSKKPQYKIGGFIPTPMLGMAKYVNTKPKTEAEFKSLYKGIRRNLIIWTVLGVTSMVILVVWVLNSSSSGILSEPPQGIDTVASGVVTPDSQKPTQASTEHRYDSNVPVGTLDYTDWSGEVHSGEYDRNNYDLSIDISNAISAKYGQPFSFFYIVGPVGDDDTVLLSGDPINKDSDRRVFTARLTDKGVQDNYYTYADSYHIGIQKWWDTNQTPKGAIDILREENGHLLGEGIDPSDVSALQNATSATLIVIEPNNVDYQDSIVPFANMIGTPSKAYTLRVVETPNEGAFYGDVTVTTKNYAKLSGKDTVIHEYNVSPDGSVKLVK